MGIPNSVFSQSALMKSLLPRGHSDSGKDRPDIDALVCLISSGLTIEFLESVSASMMKRDDFPKGPVEDGTAGAALLGRREIMNEPSIVSGLQPYGGS